MQIQKFQFQLSPQPFHFIHTIIKCNCSADEINRCSSHKECKRNFYLYFFIIYSSIGNLYRIYKIHGVRYFLYRSICLNKHYKSYFFFCISVIILSFVSPHKIFFLFSNRLNRLVQLPTATYFFFSAFHVTCNYKTINRRMDVSY